MSMQAAQVVPQNVEKLPLYHWRPGSRVLMVGSREGARFDADERAADAGAYLRNVPVDLLQEAQRQSHTDGVCANWGGSLVEPTRLSALINASCGAVVVITSGWGDADACRKCLGQVDAWLLLVDDRPGPLCETIIAQGRHVEVLWDVTSAWTLPLDGVAAVHVLPRGTADRYQAARSRVPASMPVYDDRHQHSLCDCGATLIWRHAGRSRVDALDRGRCRDCGRSDQRWVLTL